MKALFLLAACAALAGCMRAAEPITDATDDLERGVRSGMAIYTDYGTGCQYLARGSHGLTPRLDEAGRPICTGKPHRNTPNRPSNALL